MEWYIIVVLIYKLLMSNDIELFNMLIDYLYIFFVEMSIPILCEFSIKIFIHLFMRDTQRETERQRHR